MLPEDGHDHRLDVATRARMAAKDMLRGLRHEIERLKTSHSGPSGAAARAGDPLQGLLETVDKIASAGENLARDLLFTKRDMSRYADFFDPRAALAEDAEAGHRFVRSRYAALKLAVAGLTTKSALITESKIAEALADLSGVPSHDPLRFEAAFTLALAAQMPIAPDNSNTDERLVINRLAALVIGLAGVVAAHETQRDARELPDLIALCVDVVKLRQSRLIPIFDGPAADAILAPVFDELADALKDF